MDFTKFDDPVSHDFLRRRKGSHNRSGSRRLRACEVDLRIGIARTSLEVAV